MKSKNFTPEPPQEIRIELKYGKYEVELNLNPVRISDEEMGDYWETDYAIFHRDPETIDIEDIKANPENYLGYIDVAQNIQDYYERKVDEWMDATVHERGYNNINTCASYRGSKIAKFNKEGTAAFAWRDAVYVALYQYLDDVLCGRKPIPEVAELLAELPQLDW